MNIISITGRLCHTPEIKVTNGGKKVLTIDVAVKRPLAKDITDFFTTVFWEQRADYVSTYANKGDLLAISGRLTTRNYEDKNGNKRTAYEIIADSVEIVSGSKNETASAAPATQPSYAPPAADFEELSAEDELPF